MITYVINAGLVIESHQTIIKQMCAKVRQYGLTLWLTYMVTVCSLSLRITVGEFSFQWGLCA